MGESLNSNEIGIIFLDLCHLYAIESIFFTKTYFQRKFKQTTESTNIRISNLRRIRETLPFGKNTTDELNSNSSDNTKCIEHYPSLSTHIPIFRMRTNNLGYWATSVSDILGSVISRWCRISIPSTGTRATSLTNLGIRWVFRK